MGEAVSRQNEIMMPKMGGLTITVRGGQLRHRRHRESSRYLYPSSKGGMMEFSMVGTQPANNRALLVPAHPLGSPAGQSLYADGYLHGARFLPGFKLWLRDTVQGRARDGGPQSLSLGSSCWVGWLSHSRMAVWLFISFFFGVYKIPQDWSVPPKNHLPSCQHVPFSYLSTIRVLFRPSRADIIRLWVPRMWHRIPELLI